MIHCGLSRRNVYITVLQLYVVLYGEASSMGAHDKTMNHAMNDEARVHDGYNMHM